MEVIGGVATVLIVIWSIYLTLKMHSLSFYCFTQRLVGYPTIYCWNSDDFFYTTKHDRGHTYKYPRIKRGLILIKSKNKLEYGGVEYNYRTVSSVGRAGDS